MRLPLLLSVPHAGLMVPEEVAPYCCLTQEEIAADGDMGAREIYALSEHVETFVTTQVARAIVDMNRAGDDRRKDGVVKTHTCWDLPVYRRTPPEEIIATLLARYHRPYHAELSKSSQSSVRLGIDCHTMAAFGPPVGPDAGVERPAICLSNGDGTCSSEWFEGLAKCLEESFQRPVARNTPFTGGYIIRRHAAEMPWVQLELSRAPFALEEEKRLSVLNALHDWCRLTLQP